ncbi:MAG: 5'-3' exonuclease H3TH domain-containing protein [Clostridia bacterium]|nr:5'-3' exonuclease H3TH domain-containing protein [Clostridia bacterium]
MKDTFLIIDGNSLLYRAFHALPVMDYNGTYTNAIHGFLMMTLKAVAEENVRYIAVCFDEHAPTFRHVIYPEYKAGRSPTPPELIQQMDTIRTLLTDLGIRWYAMAGWEADDLLGTLSRLGEEAGLKPVLLTGDRDALQLVSNTTELLFTRKGISETYRFTPVSMYEEYGFYPEQVTDWKGMAGDSSDNIPGIPGVGDKTAVKLLQQFGSLDEILAHAGEVKGKLGEKLVTFAGDARRCRELATIRRDAPVAWKSADVAMPDLTEKVPVLQKLGLNQVIRKITGGNAPVPAAEEKPAVTVEGIDFAKVEEIDSVPALSQWLAAGDAKALLALHVTDSDMDLADETGRCCQVVLGGDLLTPGVDLGEVLALLAPEMTTRRMVVHNGKQLLHTLKKHGLPCPETFVWDTMLGAYLLNPQEKSYALSGLAQGQKDNACTMLSLARQQMA